MGRSSTEARRPAADDPEGTSLFRWLIRAAGAVFAVFFGLTFWAYSTERQFTIGAVVVAAVVVVRLYGTAKLWRGATTTFHGMAGLAFVVGAGWRVFEAGKSDQATSMILTLLIGIGLGAWLVWTATRRK